VIGTVVAMARFTPPAADAMRARLLLAARDEFAAVGLAAGRVERIGAAASSNKAQVFHYFGSKEGLFDALVADTVTETFAEAPLDTADLAAWAGRVHDSYVRRPWAQRLATWHRLERLGRCPAAGVPSGGAARARAAHRGVLERDRSGVRAAGAGRDAAAASPGRGGRGRRPARREVLTEGSATSVRALGPSVRDGAAPGLLAAPQSAAPAATRSVRSASSR
jgi:AcrR family transcriptional regulator